MEGSLHSARSRWRAGLPLVVSLLMLAACGAPPSSDSGRAKPAADAGAREITLLSARGSVQATVRPDAALAGQYLVAFAPGLRDDLTSASAGIAAVIGAATGTTPTPKIDFYAAERDRFYIGEGDERFCVQAIRESEGSGIVALRFASAARAADRRGAAADSANRSSGKDGDAQPVEYARRERRGAS